MFRRNRSILAEQLTSNSWGFWDRNAAISSCVALAQAVGQNPGASGELSRS
jgi:hypothetical protein